MSKTTILVIAVILIFIAGVVYALFRLGEVNKQEVVNRYYGSEFSFTYPLGYELLEDGNEILSIGSTGQDGFAPIVNLSRLPLATEGDVNETIRNQVVSLCAAEAPLEKVSCTVASEETVKNVLGENATLFWLTLTREVPGQEAETLQYGPVYVYAVGPNPSEEASGFSTLIAHTPVSRFLAGTADTALLTRINDSIRVGKARR